MRYLAQVQAAGSNPVPPSSGYAVGRKDFSPNGSPERRASAGDARRTWPRAQEVEQQDHKSADAGSTPDGDTKVVITERNMVMPMIV